MSKKFNIPYTGKVIEGDILGENATERHHKKKEIKSVVIPKGVERINGAFREYVKRVYGAFSYCKNLVEVDIPDSVKSIGYCAFVGTGLWDNSDKEGVVYADKWVVGSYVGKKSILKLKPDTVGIADHAFIDNKMESIVIPEGLKYIGVGAFHNCRNLKSISIPKSVTRIGVPYPETGKNQNKWDHSDLPAAGFFYHCDKLESILIESGNPIYKSENNCIIRKADNTIIAGCKNSVIPDYIKGIADFAFWACGIESVKIPKSVIDIDTNAFLEGENLKSIVVEKGNRIFGIENDCLISKIDGKQFFCLKDDGTVIIPKEIKYITRKEVEKCQGKKSLKNVKIESGVISIREHAFYACSEMRSIEIPESVVKVGWAFGECQNLLIKVYGHKSRPGGWDRGWKAQSKNVLVEWDYKEGQDKTTINKGELKFKPINNGAAYETAKAPKDISGSVVVPATYEGKPVLGIGDETFINCPYIREIIISSGITEIGCHAFSVSKGRSAIPSKIKSISIPNTVTTIGAYAFTGCNALENLEIPDSVTNFGAYFEGSIGFGGGEMFSGCASLKSIKLPKGLTKLGEKIFAQCHSLVSVVMPDNIKEIGVMAFMNCKELIDIKIPDDAIIGDKAFFGCKKLKAKMKMTL